MVSARRIRRHHHRISDCTRCAVVHHLCRRQDAVPSHRFVHVRHPAGADLAPLHLATRKRAKLLVAADARFRLHLRPPGRGRDGPVQVRGVHRLDHRGPCRDRRRPQPPAGHPLGRRLRRDHDDRGRDLRRLRGRVPRCPLLLQHLGEGHRRCARRYPAAPAHRQPVLVRRLDAALRRGDVVGDDAGLRLRQRSHVHPQAVVALR